MQTGVSTRLNGTNERTHDPARSTRASVSSVGTRCPPLQSPFMKPSTALPFLVGTRARLATSGSAFVPSFLRALVCFAPPPTPLNRPFVCLFVRLFLRSLLCSFVCFSVSPFVCLSVRLFVGTVHRNRQRGKDRRGERTVATNGRPIAHPQRPHRTQWGGPDASGTAETRLVCFLVRSFVLSQGAHLEPGAHRGNLRLHDAQATVPQKVKRVVGVEPSVVTN